MTGKPVWISICDIYGNTHEVRLHRIERIDHDAHTIWLMSGKSITVNSEVAQLVSSLLDNVDEDGPISDGALFRFWIAKAASEPGMIANALCNCITVDDYRQTITALITGRPIKS